MLPAEVSLWLITTQSSEPATLLSGNLQHVAFNLHGLLDCHHNNDLHRYNKPRLKT
jgi:hypothetical protein